MPIDGFPEVGDPQHTADLNQGSQQYLYAEHRLLQRESQWWKAHAKMFVARFKGNAQSGQPLNQSDLELILATEDTFSGR